MGTMDGLLTVKKSFLLLLVGEWLLLLLNLLCLQSLVFAVSNSWLLLIPGVNFLKLTSRSISWSSWLSMEDGVLGLFPGNLTVKPFWGGERTGDLMGDLTPPFPGLERLMRWWSHTTRSRIYPSVFSLSAWWSVSTRIRSVCPAGFRFTSDLKEKRGTNNSIWYVDPTIWNYL